MVAPSAALISPRGKVLENEMPRRLAKACSMKMTRAAVRTSWRIWLKKILSPIALGYSNGANIAAAELFLRPEFLRPEVVAGANLAERLHVAERPRPDIAGTGEQRLVALEISVRPEPIAMALPSGQ
jgi:phospholipase/carboxylesterase